MSKDEDFLIYDQSVASWPIVVSTTEYTAEFDDRYGSGRRVEVPDNVTAAFRFTCLHLRLYDDDSNIPIDRVQAFYGHRLLRAVNHFLDCYRHVTKRHGIQNVKSFDQFSETRVGRVGPDGQNKFVITIGFGGQMITPWLPMRLAEEHVRMQNLCAQDEPMPLHGSLLMEAERYAEMGHHLQATIFAQSSIEVFLGRHSNQIRHNWRIVRFLASLLRCLRKRELLEVRMNNLLANEEAQTKKRLISDLRLLIDDRNSIIHRGRRELKHSSDSGTYIRLAREIIDIVETSCPV
ncbi:hypothetical protein HY634_02970 [Candidatus Uhrbacteria bacterium]|nr:hypothetical protein [Candidatus Uhrbacteria bacterium]